MSLVVGVAHSLGRQVRVDLGGRQRLMAEQLLDGTEIRAVVQQMCSEGVTQGVRTDGRIEADLLEILADLASNRAGGDPCVLLVHEQRHVGTEQFLGRFTPHGQAMADRGDGM